MVVNCAGEGRRLGLGSTKALVSVHGDPLIAWHLKLLRNVEDVVVVVGHQAQDVIDAVRAVRRDVAFAINHNYKTTGTAASLALGCRGARGDVISLDGDLLVHPEDFSDLVAETDACVGVAPPNTTDAVFASVTDGRVTAFDRTGPGLEWTGLLRVPGRLIQDAHAEHRTGGHVFEMLLPHLPLRARNVRAREIDTPDDYERAVAWMAPIVQCWN